MMKKKSQLILFQNLGTLLALLLSTLALFVSIYEANILKTQQKSMVWPYFEIENNYDDSGFKLISKNKGTGPAIITKLEVSYDNQKVNSYLELIKKMNKNNSFSYENIGITDISNTVIKAGEEIQIISLPWNEQTSEIIGLFSRYLNIEVEYCSVLGDCWQYQFPKKNKQIVNLPF